MKIGRNCNPMYVFERAPSQTPVSTPNPASTHHSSNITYPVRTQNEKEVNRHPDVLVWTRRSLHTRTYRFARTFHYTFWCSMLAACLAYSYRFFFMFVYFFLLLFFALCHVTYYFIWLLPSSASFRSRGARTCLLVSAVQLE